MISAWSTATSTGCPRSTPPLGPLTAYELVDRRVTEGGPDEPSHTPDVDLAALEPDVGRPQLDVAPDGDPSSGARSA